MIRRILAPVILAALAAVLTYMILPAVGWTADTSEAVVSEGIDVGRWARDLGVIGGVVAGAVAMLLPLAVAVLKVIRAWAVSEARREALDATIAAIEGLRHDVDRLPGVSSGAPAENVSARTRAWSELAAPLAVAEFRAAIRRVKKK